MSEACPVCHGADRAVDVQEVHPGLNPAARPQGSIDSVSIAVDDTAQTAILTVNFTVKDADGNYIPNFTAPNPTNPSRFAYIRFALSELQPPAEGSGDTPIWVNYTTRDATPANVADHLDGTYTYVFATNLYSKYNPAWTQRLLLQVSGAIFPAPLNLTYDFVGNQIPGPYTFETTRNIATTPACNGCHNVLGSPLGAASFHGGSRYLVEACTVCHTSTLGGGTASLAPFIHGIHTAQDEGELGDYSDVTYPQDPRNCDTCHAGTDGDSWNTTPTIVGCGSCHTNVNFATGENHGGGAQANNSGCQLCHQPTGGLAPIIPAHAAANTTPNNVPAGLIDVEYVLEQVTVNESNQAVVTFHVNADGSPLDVNVFPPTGFTNSSTPSFLVLYALPQDGNDVPAEYNNRGRSGGQPATVSLSSLAGTLTGTPASYTATLTSAAFPAGAVMRAIALQGYYTQAAGGSVAANTARHTESKVMKVEGDVERRVVVDQAKCLACHNVLELHGGNRVNDPQVCVGCHNPNLSSSGRGSNPANMSDDEKAKLAAAGYDPTQPLTWPEATNNFKDMIHGIHAAAVRSTPYEFVRNRNTSGVFFYDWSEVTFPGIPSDCETCHKPGTYDVNLPTGVLVSTDITTNGNIVTPADVNASRTTVPNPTDLIISPTAAACYKCHDNNPAAFHFSQNGGVIDAERATALSE